jgi:hypothetical protein
MMLYPRDFINHSPSSRKLLEQASHFIDTVVARDNEQASIHLKRVFNRLVGQIAQHAKARAVTDPIVHRSIDRLGFRKEYTTTIARIVSRVDAQEALHDSVVISNGIVPRLPGVGDCAPIVIAGISILLEGMLKHSCGCALLACARTYHRRCRFYQRNSSDKRGIAPIRKAAHPISPT